MIDTIQEDTKSTNCSSNDIYFNDVFPKLRAMAKALKYDYLVRSLRLLCLLYIACSGLTPNESHIIQKSHLHAHGYEYVPLFFKLEACGFLR
ncbi:Protein of unknown function [Cotesia congregata]|uniref:Uncharacterized protein n=1 Tax=Cotesia congregata TaxID=51543 RepID=A0A8J2HLU3_COTCN|nr:Protein of unknown function [Cotesia congregata]